MSIIEKMRGQTFLRTLMGLRYWHFGFGKQINKMRIFVPKICIFHYPFWEINRANIFFSLANWLLEFLFTLTVQNLCCFICNSVDSQCYTMACLLIFNVPIFIKVLYLWVLNQIVLCFNSASWNKTCNISVSLRSSQEFDHSFVQLWIHN